MDFRLYLIFKSEVMSSKKQHLTMRGDLYEKNIYTVACGFNNGFAYGAQHCKQGQRKAVPCQANLQAKAVSPNNQRARLSLRVHRNHQAYLNLQAFLNHYFSPRHSPTPNHRGLLTPLLKAISSPENRCSLLHIRQQRSRFKRKKSRTPDKRRAVVFGYTAQWQCFKQRYSTLDKRSRSKYYN